MNPELAIPTLVQRMTDERNKLANEIHALQDEYDRLSEAISILGDTEEVEAQEKKPLVRRGRPKKGNKTIADRVLEVLEVIETDATASQITNVIGNVPRTSVNRVLSQLNEKGLVAVTKEVPGKFGYPTKYYKLIQDAKV